MSKITTIIIRCPIWKAGTIRDKLYPAMVGSAEITVSESWTIRRPLTWEFTIIGPSFQAHKVASDAGAIGEAFYHTIPVCLALLFLASPAMAAEKPIPASRQMLLAPGTYAVRGVCATIGAVYMAAWSPSYGSLMSVSDYCTNGRAGGSFTVPDGPAQLITFSLANLILPAKINPDCAEGVATTCAINVVSYDPHTGLATAAGAFTYPGDVDWFAMSDQLRFDNVKITTVKAGCFATGRVSYATTPDGYWHPYLAVVGGPSSCVYNVEARPRYIPDDGGTD